MFLRCLSLQGNYICPRCGRRTRILIEGLCPKCYAELKGPQIVPSFIEAEVCRYCGSVRLGYKWVETKGSFEDVIMKVLDHQLRSIKNHEIIKDISLKEVNFLTKPNWTTKLLLSFEGNVAGEKVDWKVALTVRLRPSICPKCITRISGEYDTLVQIRGAVPNDMERKVPEIAEVAGVINDMVDIIGEKEGVDVFFTHIGAARKFIKEMSRRYKISWKGPYREAIGISSSGKKRSRNTFVVRILVP